MKSRGRFVAIAAVVLGLLTVIGAGTALKDRALELWHFWRGTTDSAGFPMWLRYHLFKYKTFDFARVRYTSLSSRRRPGDFGEWAVDYPDADQNLSRLLAEITSLKVNTEGKVLRLTDSELPRYPFLYISSPGDLSFSEAEVASLRHYLLNGGFLMVDDFWGDQDWEGFYSQIKLVFPDREPQELPLEHPVFHCVFDLKEKPQVCSIAAALAGRSLGITWESSAPNDREVHYRGIMDDKGRMMVILCHNTDLADGWERAEEDDYYAREFSHKRAFPMAVNIIFYALTH